MSDILTTIECKTASDEIASGRCSAISLKLANRMLATIKALEARIEALEKPPRPSDLSDAVNLVQRAMTCIEAVPDGLWPAWDKELSEAFNCLDDAVGTPARCLEEAALVAKEDK